MNHVLLAVICIIGMVMVVLGGIKYAGQENFSKSFFGFILMFFGVIINVAAITHVMMSMPVKPAKPFLPTAISMPGAKFTSQNQMEIRALYCGDTRVETVLVVLGRTDEHGKFLEEQKFVLSNK